MSFRSHVRPFASALPLLAFRAVGGGMPILLGLLVAHQWGLEELAAFTLAHATITIVMVVADWGATRGLPRNLATLPPGAAAQFLASANGVRVLIVAAVLAAGIAAAALGFVEMSVAQYLAILFPICPLFGVTTTAVSERVIVRETVAIALAVAGGLVTFAVLGGAALALDLGPHAFVGAFVAGKIVEAALIARGRWWVLAVSMSGLRSIALALWPFSAQAIVAVLYARAAVFTVEHMTTRVELGVFSVAMGMQSGLLLIPASIALMHFPELTRLARADDARGTRQILVRYAIVSGIGIVLALIVLAAIVGPISSALKFPGRYGSFLLAFAAVALLGVFSTMASFLMQARGMEMAAARLSLWTLCLAIVYQVAALSLWGLWGIVGAVAAAEITATAIFTIALRRPAAGVAGD